MCRQLRGHSTTRYSLCPPIPTGSVEAACLGSRPSSLVYKVRFNNDLKHLQVYKILREGGMDHIQIFRGPVVRGATKTSLVHKVEQRCWWTDMLASQSSEASRSRSADSGGVKISLVLFASKRIWRYWPGLLIRTKTSPDHLDRTLVKQQVSCCHSRPFSKY